MKNPQQTSNVLISQKEKATESSLSSSSVPEIPESRYDLRIFQAVRKIIRSTDQYSRKISQNFGVTVPQLVCLLKVVEAGPISIRKIADEIFLSPSTLVGIIDRLEKQELVKRERQKKDRRQVLVAATPKGIELIKQSPSLLQDSLADALQQIAESEQATIAKSLERIVELMEIKKIDAAPILETKIKLDSPT